MQTNSCLFTNSGIVGNSFLKAPSNWLGICFCGSLMKDKVPQEQVNQKARSRAGREIDLTALLWSQMQSSSLAMQ